MNYNSNYESEVVSYEEQYNEQLYEDEEDMFGDLDDYYC